MTPLSYIARHAQERPDALAALDDGAEVTYATLWGDVIAVRDALRARNLPARRLIGLHLQSAYENCVAQLGTHLAGLPVACVQGKFLRQIQHLKATRLFSDVPATLAKATRGAVELEPGWLRKLPRPQPLPESAACPMADDGLMLVSLSSGTTGKVKRIPVSRAQLESRVETNFAQRYAGLAPLRHFNPGSTSQPGNYANILAIWQLGGSVVFEQRLHPAESIVRHEPDEVRTFPAMAWQILERLPAAFRPRKPMRIYMGGARVTPALYAALVERLGASVEEGYGATESQVMASCGPLAPGEPWTGEMTLTPWCTAEVVDAAGRPLPAGEPGLLRVRTPAMPGRYMGDAELTAKHWRDGWFYPGDIASFTAAGKLRLLGRQGDLLNLGGVKLPAVEVEERVARVAGVRDAAAFGVPGSEGSDELWVAIVVDPAAKPKREDLQAAVGRLARLGRVRFLVLPAFPRNEAGKVMRRKLVAEAQRKRQP